MTAQSHAIFPGSNAITVVKVGAYWSCSPSKRKKIRADHDAVGHTMRRCPAEKSEKPDLMGGTDGYNNGGDDVDADAGGGGWVASEEAARW